MIYLGEEKAVGEWHRELLLTIPLKIVGDRIRAGWLPNKAFYHPVKKKNIGISNFIPHSFGHINKKSA